MCWAIKVKGKRAYCLGNDSVRVSSYFVPIYSVTNGLFLCRIYRRSVVPILASFLLAFYAQSRGIVSNIWRSGDVQSVRDILRYAVVFVGLKKKNSSKRLDRT